MKARSKVLAASCIAEIFTGLALLAAPSLVTSLLLGAEMTGPAVIVGRVAGVALIALAIACRPNARQGDDGAFAGMLIYNMLVALLLAEAGIRDEASSKLLWPTVGFHAVLALLLAVYWLRERSQTTAE